MMYQHLGPDYQEKVMERWAPVLAEGEEIKSEQVRLATALVLENTQRQFSEGMATQGGSIFGTKSDYSHNDSRQATTVIPMARRFFPNMFAHKVVGVQPMNGPLGLAYAIRSVYGHKTGPRTGDNIEIDGSEIGYNTVKGGHTGATSEYATSTEHRSVHGYAYDPTVVGVGEDKAGKGAVGISILGAADAPALSAGLQTMLTAAIADATSAKGSALTTQEEAAVTADFNATYGGKDGDQASDFWRAFAGANSQITSGAELASTEWLDIERDMATAEIRYSKSVVVAKSRKLGAHWSREMAEDMTAMSGIDTNAEMVSTLSYEIQAELDRELLGEMARAAILAKNVSYYDPASSDGRWQLERYSSFYTDVIDVAQAIAVRTRRGAANFAVAAPKAVTLFQRLQSFQGDTAKAGTVNTAGDLSVSEMGVTEGGIQVYRDTFAGGDYCLLGYKGGRTSDSGVMYCPYVPVTLWESTGQGDDTPRIGVRTRYGVMNNMFGAGNYYHFIKLANLGFGNNKGTYTV